ncbi:MAG: SMC-Scp complex subunit ScpB, partial [Thermoguttaceae bacterium]
ARTLVRTLNRRYDSEGSAFRIEEVAGGFQLMTRLKFAPWLRRLHSASTEVRLSAPAMETLAVVAYRQPILRADIEAIRGVQSGEVLRQLIERDLVRIVGRSSELGRPFLYGTTRQFLQVFGLRHLDELPRADVLRTRRTPAESPQNAAETSSHTTTETIPSSIQAPVAAEETHVKTSITQEPRRKTSATHQEVATENLRHDELFGREMIARREDDEDDDLDDDLEGEEEDEDDKDDDLDEQPWEEVEEDDDLDEDEEEDEDWDDEDWDDDEDEDWDDDDEEDDDWDDEDEDEEDEKE